ncbi:MAG: NYN domain-containing protein [Parcubacteria group bacterium]|nr:NYN domain-containing protein [Parcubacteria group bacterium]
MAYKITAIASSLPKFFLPSKKNQTVAVFVDAQNMYHSARNLYKARVNFKELLKFAVAARNLVKANAYVIKSDIPEEQGFFEALERSGYYLKMKDLQIFPGGMKKADWDVGIAIDAISMAPKAEVMVFATGDGDFIPLLEYLKHQGITVEVVAFRRSTSSKLIQAADKFYDLEEEVEKFLLRK